MFDRVQTNHIRWGLLSAMNTLGFLLARVTAGCRPTVWSAAFLLLLPITSAADSRPGGAFDDDHHVDVWVQGGVGVSFYEEQDRASGLLPAASAGAALRVSFVAALVRWAGGANMFSESFGEVAILGGPFIATDDFTLLLAVGPGRVWGTRGADGAIVLAPPAQNWGPIGSTAWEAQIGLPRIPWIAFTAFGNVNKESNFWGAYLSWRIGSFLGEP